MKQILIFLSVIYFLSSCKTVDSQNKYLTYQNIVILSDLSSRLQNKPPKDTEEIHKLVSFFRDECVKPGEKIGDKSCLTFSSLTSKNIASVDLQKFKTVGEKQQFVNSTGNHSNDGLQFQLDEFEKKVKAVYTGPGDKGLDLISVLIEKIENEPIVKLNTYLTDGIDTTFLNYENNIYIFTDGYLEYQGKRENNEFYFGVPEIERIRKYCLANRVDIAEALKSNPSFGLPATKTKNARFINLHILETHERDKNDNKQNYANKMALRDNAILEAVWHKWADDSGFKDLKWSKY